MQPFIITTEDTSDSPVGYYAAHGVLSIPLHYLVNGEEYTSHTADAKDFFNALRAGAKASTSQINAAEYEAFWRPLLAEGNDILHLGFSSALSGTFKNAKQTADELKKEFPERKILVLDTCSQSGGQGLLVRLVSEYKEKGHLIEECFAYAQETYPKVCHVFTVNDLRWLIGTGRVTNAEAFLGNLLQIKPVLYTSVEGVLTPHTKVIGRKLALNWMCEKVKAKFTGAYGTIYVSHGDCPKDVEFVKRKLEPLGAQIEVLDISPIIACHTGPDVLAIFFVGKDRGME